MATRRRARDDHEGDEAIEHAGEKHEAPKGVGGVSAGHKEIDGSATKVICNDKHRGRCLWMIGDFKDANGLKIRKEIDELTRSNGASKIGKSSRPIAQ
jgi:hypothetical protein